MPALKLPSMLWLISSDSSSSLREAKRARSQRSAATPRATKRHEKQQAGNRRRGCRRARTASRTGRCRATAASCRSRCTGSTTAPVSTEKSIPVLRQQPHLVRRKKLLDPIQPHVACPKPLPVYRVDLRVRVAVSHLHMAAGQG